VLSGGDTLGRRMRKATMLRGHGGTEIDTRVAYTLFSELFPVGTIFKSAFHGALRGGDLFFSSPSTHSHLSYNTTL
jgi:hypothetical protein